MGLAASQFDDEDMLRPEEIEDLQSISGFSRDEIVKLYRRFRTLDRTGDGTISEDDLRRVPDVAMNPMVDRVVGYFGFGPHAQALSGKTATRINFTDFINALSVFNSRRSKEERLEQVFRAFDLDSDGVLAREEFVSMLQTVVGNSMSQGDVDALAEYALQEVQRENGLKFKDFLEVLESSSEIDSLFRANLVPAPKDQVSDRRPRDSSLVGFSRRHN